ncbi:hypothetical protein GCM10018966_091140 [Streptomyces yanii]
MRAEQDPGQDEQGNGREADPAADPGEDSGGEEGAAHGYERVCVSDEPDPSVGQENVKKSSVISLPNDFGGTGAPRWGLPHP